MPIGRHDGIGILDPTSGIGGMNFTLSDGVDYYTSVRAKDQAGNLSTSTSSDAWQLPQNGLAKTFWFDASDRTTIKDSLNLTPDDPGFNGRVRRWEDKSSSTLDATSVGAANDPGYASDLNKITFSGTNQYLRIPSSGSFDSGTFNHKNVFISFHTPLDLNTRQMIYEQGNRDRGMNLYILNGKLYCGFWNAKDDGDGYQAFTYTTSTNNLAPSTVYHSAIVLDYTNYSGAGGANGEVKCYLNNTQMGSTLSTTSRLFAHGGTAAFGATWDTRYHDTNTNKVEAFFKGKILEAIMFQDHPSPLDISTTLTTLMTKWSSGELSSPGNLALLNNSTLTKAVTASWNPISSTYFETDHYQIAISTNVDSTDILYWTNIGNVTTYTPEDGIDGVSLSLAYNTDYYLMVKAVDVYGNESGAAVSELWRVLPAGSTTLAGTFLQLDATDLSNILDGANVASNQPGFSNVVAHWRNKINQSVNNFTQTTAASRPNFNVAMKSAIFDKSNDFLSTSSETNLTNSTVASKTVSMVFTTSTDITSRQFLLELGDRDRGLSVYIENENLYCLFHQDRSNGDGAQAPVWITSPVIRSSSYVVSLYLDYSNYTGASGPDGTVGCVVNGVLEGTVSTTSRWYASANEAYIGYRKTARWHNGVSNNSGDYFGGEIHEVQMTNTWPTNGVSDIEDLQENLMIKW